MAVALAEADYEFWKSDLFEQRAKARATDNFFIDALRSAFMEGKVGYREGLTHRIIGESGGGQTRSQQPAGKGGTPT